VGRTVGVKGYAEKVEVYASGKLIASHMRCFEKHQSVYKLEHYLPLLEQRGRAILNAAPVRQNVPESVMAQLKANAPRQRLTLLRQCCESLGPEAPAITDVVLVQPVDLRKYDELVDGKAVNTRVL